MDKSELIESLIELYNDNKLSERDECTILNTLGYLGFDITML